MVAVAGMQRPKPLPNEALADFAVSAATKVQCLRVVSHTASSISCPLFYYYPLPLNAYSIAHSSQ